MKTLVHIECISENAYFMQFYVIISDLPSFIQLALNVIEYIGDLPVESNITSLIFFEISLWSRILVNQVVSTFHYGPGFW